MSGGVRSAPVRSVQAGQVKSCKVRSGWVMSGQVQRSVTILNQGSGQDHTHGEDKPYAKFN